MAIQGNQVQTMDPVSEMEATLPAVPRRIVAGDGTEPKGTGAPAADLGAEPEQPQGQTLETAGDQDVFRTLDMLSRSQERLRLNRYAIDLYHTWLDANVQFGRLEKIPSQNKWIAKLAPGVSAERAASVPNKTSDLCNKVTDALLADPPKPEPSPVDSEDTNAAADLVARFLIENASESGINEVQQFRWALRNALVRSSSFLEYDVDDEGGGYQAKQILAHPQAQSVDAPMVGPDGMPTTDPVLRYVSGNQFVQTADQADRVWLPRVVVRQHQRTKVLMFPANVSIENAEALHLTDWRSLAQARKEWPDTVGQMSDTELMALCAWKPPVADVIVPFAFKGGTAEGMTGPDLATVGNFSPILQRRMFFYRFYVRKCREYPRGLKIDVSGANGGTILAREPMEYAVQEPEGGTAARCMDIPLVHVVPSQDVTDLDPMGWPFSARFDGSAQASASLMAGYLDALDRMAHPHVFIRSTSTVDEDEWYDRSKPIVLSPDSQEPTYEKFPQLPPIVEVDEYLQTRQDTSSGLTATAQGLDTKTSESGIAKRLTVRQAQISLAGIQQQLHAAFTRGWRIVAQLVQAKFTTPQVMSPSGEESSDEAEWWTGEDFAGIDDIGIASGSGTMMTAEDKANYVAFLQEQQWLSPDRAAEIGVSGIARDIGLPRDAVEAGIERSVALWLKGPPNPEWIGQYQQWKAAQTQYQAAVQQYNQANQLYQTAVQMRGLVAGGAPPIALGPEQQNAEAMLRYQMAVEWVQANPQAPFSPPQPPQAPQIPMPWTPFPPRPNDTEPEVAARWMKRLSHLQFSPSYTKQPQEWREIADTRYNQARQAQAVASGAGQQAVPQQPQPMTPGASPVQQPQPAQGQARAQHPTVQHTATKPPPAQLPQHGLAA